MDARAEIILTPQISLAINASLEADKLRQSREIRDLRRRLRESRLSLPPRTYNELVKSSPEEPSLEESDDEDQAAQEPDPDPVYDHVRDLIDSLLVRATQAMENVEKPPSTAAFKVLSAAEVETYEHGRKAAAEQIVRSNGANVDVDTEAGETDTEDYEGDGMSLVMEVDESVDDDLGQPSRFGMTPPRAESPGGNYFIEGGPLLPPFTLNIQDPDISIDE